MLLFHKNVNIKISEYKDYSKQSLLNRDFQALSKNRLDTSYGTLRRRTLKDLLSVAWRTSIYGVRHNI